MAKKKKRSRVAFSDEASVISDKSSNTAPSANESDSHTASGSESTVTGKNPTIRFRSTPPKRPGPGSRISAREVPQPSGQTNYPHNGLAGKQNASRSGGHTIPSIPLAASSGGNRMPSVPQGEPTETKNQDELLLRISSAIPDLHLLLDKYKATHGELSLQDQIRRRFEAQAAELVRSKDETITALMTQLEESARQRGDEASKLKARVATLELSHAQLKEQTHNAEARAKHAEEHHRRAMKANEELVAERTMIIRRAHEDKEKSLKRQEREIREEYEKKLNDLKKELESKMSKEKERHESDLKDIKEKHDNELSAQKGDLESKLSKAEDDIKELGGTDTELKEKYKLEWEKKEEELIKKHEEEMGTLRKAHKDYCNDQIRGFLSLQESLNKALTEENTALKELLAEYKASAPTVKVEDSPEGE